ncbi:hypothetical protein ACFL4J_01425, partial [Candidatus Margulisiibacteriota bacterium]
MSSNCNIVGYYTTNKCISGNPYQETSPINQYFIIDEKASMLAVAPPFDRSDVTLAQIYEDPDCLTGEFKIVMENEVIINQDNGMATIGKGDDKIVFVAHEFDGTRLANEKEKIQKMYALITALNRFIPEQKVKDVFVYNA